MLLEPRDSHNALLEAAVHPEDWTNPTPATRYNLVVIGAGTAGLVTAAGAAGLGAKVALVERHLMGGDCLNVGCVPSKGVISAARVAAIVRDAEEFGVRVVGPPEVDFSAAMDRMRRLRSAISQNDSVARFAALGVDVFLGEGRFTGRDTVQVGDAELRYSKAVIATGARAVAPPLPGLDQVRYLTNESVFSLTQRPARFGVIGAGPIGVEMAQSFARLGSEVVLVEAEHGILPREERAAADIVGRAIAHDGVRVLCCGKHTRFSQDSEGIHVTLDSHGRGYHHLVDELLVSVGRQPNVDGLGLEAASVDFDPKRGVTVDDRLRTTNPRVFAAGDIASRFQFTHAADFMARLVIRNALFRGRSKASALVIPWCTYTSPEVAHVGLTERDAKERSIAIDTFVQPLAEVDRAILEGEDDGFVKVHVRQGTDEIVGATIVARNAGDMISEITLAMTQKIGLKAIAETIHPYPTQAEAVRKLGDQFNRTRLTPFVKLWLARWLAWTR